MLEKRYHLNNHHNMTNVFLIFREIQVATGDWINDYLNRGSVEVDNNGKRRSNNNTGRLYVAQPPGTAAGNEEMKKNIKRSWTISS